MFFLYFSPLNRTLLLYFRFEILLVVNQFYLTDGENEYVIRGNSAILKCKIPSFIADFVTVDAWIDNDGNEYSHTKDEYG